MSMNKTLSALCGTALVFATACTDADRFLSGDENQNTKGGAVAGAITGAIVGATVSGEGDKGKGAVIGAVVGGVSGGLIGQRLDQQEADLRRDLGNDQVRIVNTGSELIVTMPQDILFSVDSTTVRSDLRRDLGSLAGNLQAYPNTTIQVVGHTDSTGSASYNQNLSQRRAEAVSSILVANGVPSRRIVSVGRGEAQPVASNDTASGRAQNRRVDIIITPF